VVCLFESDRWCRAGLVLRASLLLEIRNARSNIYPSNFVFLCLRRASDS
jgi:hypothetical protein